MKIPKHMKYLMGLGLLGMSVSGIAAASVPNNIPHAIDWGTTSVSFTIQTVDENWKFEVNEPDEGVLVDAVYGSEGTLTINYPVGFCGLLQADASLNGTHVYGSRYTVTDCTVPTTTTTTTTVPPTTTTTSPPTTTTTTLGKQPCCITPQPPTSIPPAPPVAPQSAPAETTTTLPNIPPESNGMTNGNG